MNAQLPKHLSSYLTLKKPLTPGALASLKKWIRFGVPGVEERLHHPQGGCCCCCCCEGDPHGGKGEVTLAARVDLWTLPSSYPKPEIVDIYAELSWQAPPGSKVVLEVQHLRANGSILRDWASPGPDFENLPPTGFRVWDPPLVPGGGYGYRVCFRARTDAGALSPVTCRSANQ